MKYIPSVNIIQQQQDEQEKQQIKKRIGDAMDDLYNLPRNPVSDTTSFIVKSTSIDTNKLEDKRFRSRNELFILATDMFSALSNLEDVDQTLTQLIWQDMKFALRFGFMRRAETKALELIRVYNESRGRKGRFSTQLITTREELIAKHNREQEQTRKRGFLGFKQPKHEIVDEGLDGEFTK
jgi:hypothetical protein